VNRNNFGQSIWNKGVMLLKTFWGTHWELEEPFEKILRTPWELLWVHIENSK